MSSCKLYRCAPGGSRCAFAELRCLQVHTQAAIPHRSQRCTPFQSERRRHSPAHAAVAVQEHAANAAQRLDTPPPVEGKLASHIHRTLKRMSVVAERECDILGGAARVDICFAKPLEKRRRVRGPPVVLEVDGPSHFLLELPRTAGEQLAAEERDVYTTIRGLLAGKRVDEAASVQELFPGDEWGAQPQLC